MISDVVAGQIVGNVAGGILLLCIALVATRSMGTATLLLAAQSALIAVAILATAAERTSAELAAAGLLTIGVRVVVVPIALRRLVRTSPVRHERRPLLGRYTSIAAAIAIVFVAVIAVRDTVPTLAPATALAVTAAVATVLSGLLLVVTRRKSISMVIGLIAFENGIALAAFALTAGMPLLVELGVAFDVLILLVVVRVHSRQMLTTFGSLSTDQLRNLRG